MKERQSCEATTVALDVITWAKLSYRLREYYINSSHHAQSFLCVCVPSVCGGQRARRWFNWHGKVPNDGWMAGWGETVSQCLFRSR